MNEAATLGGAIGNDAYLRFWDGRVLIPWRGATFPNSPGPGAVDLIGAGGHFRTIRSIRVYGMPDGSAFQMGLRRPCEEVLRCATSIDTVMSSERIDRTTWCRNSTRRSCMPMADSCNLSTAVVDGPAEIRDTTALNDDRHIVATAIVAGERRSVVLVPNAPSPPSALSFIVSGAMVVLTWTASAGADEYFVEAGSVSGARDLYAASVGPLPSLVTSAPPGRYYVRVCAKCVGHKRSIE